jgi:hypothetical protein
MTYEQAVRLASRLVVLYLLCWVLGDLTALPREVFAVYEAWNFPGLSGGGTYLREQILLLSSNVLRIAIWLALALWFYQCGPRVRGWFGVCGSPELEEGQTTSE